MDRITIYWNEKDWKKKRFRGEKKPTLDILSLKCQLGVQTEAEQATTYMNMKFGIQRGSISGIPIRQKLGLGLIRLEVVRKAMQLDGII